MLIYQRQIRGVAYYYQKGVKKMKKNAKRLLAMLICLVLVVGVLPVGALAADTGEVTITKTDIKADSVFNTGGMEVCI
jgi:mannose/fructose/N-acetylgalactosamine-specific phosphotransferase system component IID